MPYKLYVGNNTSIHRKNQIGLDLLIKEKLFDITYNMDEAQIVIYFSGSPIGCDRIHYFDINDEKYKNKLFILGPHFSVFPSHYIQTLQVVNNNIIYNCLSDWVKNMWQAEIQNNLVITTLPYPVDVENFKPDENLKKTNDVFVYIKYRFLHDASFIIEELKKLNYNVHIFNYKEKYDENNYIEVLKKSVFGIWIGCHESQGFGLLEALSCNVPLLVYNVTNMGQEEGRESEIKSCNTIATTTPYWDKRCGESFTKGEDFQSTFELFQSQLQNYKPREYVLENLSPKGIIQKYWKPIIEKYISTISN